MRATSCRSSATCAARTHMPQARAHPRALPGAIQGGAGYFLRTSESAPPFASLLTLALASPLSLWCGDEAPTSEERVFGVLAADDAYALGGVSTTGVLRGEAETDGLFCMLRLGPRGVEVAIDLPSKAIMCLRSVRCAPRDCQIACGVAL